MGDGEEVKEYGTSEGKGREKRSGRKGKGRYDDRSGGMGNKGDG